MKLWTKPMNGAIPLFPLGTSGERAGEKGSKRPPLPDPLLLVGGCVFSAMVGMARCAVPARVVAGGTNIRATLALEEVAPLHAARTSQRDVPTTLNTNGVKTPGYSQGVPSGQRNAATRFFFLSPRRRRGERTEERGVLTESPSSPRPSPPSDGGEGVSLAAVPAVCENRPT